jgi:hypothetical protein
MNADTSASANKTLLSLCKSAQDEGVCEREREREGEGGREGEREREHAYRSLSLQS